MVTETAISCACLHCGLPSPEAAPGDDGPFCCRGCATAYRLIRANGLERYYELCEPAGECAMLPRGTDRSYAEYDDGSFLTKHAKPLEGGLCRVDLLLSGIHCGACVWLLERLPRLLPGVLDSRINLHRATISLTWNPAAIRLSRVCQTLDSLGYQPSPLRSTSPGRAAAGDRRDLIALGVAGACAGNAMLYAICLYAGIFEGIEPANAALFRWLSLAVTAVAIAWPGRVFLTNAWAALRTRTPHLDLPISLALVAGSVWSVVSTVRGEGEVYFDSLSVLVFVLLTGRFLQKRRQQAGANAVELLFSLTSPTARRLDEAGISHDVPADALAPGERIEVRAGDTFPADGVVCTGSSTVDLSLLSGESRPVAVAAESPVYAGATNLGSPLTVRVTKTGEDTRVAALVRLVEDASRRRAPIVLMADRLSGAFVVGMLSLAVVSYISYLFVHPSVALERAVALLVVTCPCALGLATPLTLVVALGRAARAGVLIKGGDSLQKIASPGTLFLDKTGTITSGTPRVLHWTGDDSLRPLVAALELQANHPVAAALREGYEHEARTLTVADLTHTLGAGVSGVVKGRRLVVGSAEHIRFSAATDAASLQMLGLADSYAREGLTPVVIAATDGGILTPLAVAALGDRIRPDARSSVAALRALGYRPVILSGDHPAVVARVAEAIGIDPADAHGGLSPEDKAARVREAGRTNPAFFVGDGVNDAAALATAAVGIAVHSGAEAALAAADIYISKPGLSPLVDLVRGARDAMSTIRRNLALSFVYNLLAVAGTLAGLVTPLLAALIMPLSSITVLSVALRSRVFRPVVPPPARPEQDSPAPKEAPAWA